MSDVSRSLENLSDAGRASKARKMAGKVCHSFAALTLVLMADGSAKRIDQVEVGDRVAATEITSGRVVSAEVSVLHRNFDSDLVDVEVEGADGVRSVVHTTSRHLWWSVGRGGWVEAADLVAGDRLWSADGERVVVVDTRWVGGSDWMYDLTVDDVHTFHVLAGDTPVLVHNNNADDCLNPGATEAAQRGPKPWPEGPHNQTIQRRISELEADGMTHTAGGSLPEEVIPTPGGCKTCRRPDITMTGPDGTMYRENVGRSLANGSPVPREVSALDDLEAALGTRPGYTAYDR